VHPGPLGVARNYCGTEVFDFPALLKQLAAGAAGGQ